MTRAMMSETDAHPIRALPIGLERAITAAVTAHRSEAGPASPRLIERLRALEDEARARVDPQARQIFASARRLLGDPSELSEPVIARRDPRTQRSFAELDRNHHHVPLE